MTKADLHVHSKASKKALNYVLEKLNMPESFAEPIQIYRTLKCRGMDIVTLTDHDTIEGNLELLERKIKDVMISEEISAKFPDGAKFHLLAYDLSEGQHLELQKRRNNVFDIARYIHRNEIVSSVAHSCRPPFEEGDVDFTYEHFLQLFVLFRNFESNGCDPVVVRKFMERFMKVKLQEKDMLEYIADKYGIKEPVNLDPCSINVTGGSDDHTGRLGSRKYTENDGRRFADARSTIDDFLDNFDNNRVKGVEIDNPYLVSMSVASIGLQGALHKIDLEKCKRWYPDITKVTDIMLVENTGHKWYNILPWVRKKAGYPRFHKGNPRYHVMKAIEKMPDFTPGIDYLNAPEKFSKAFSHLLVNITRSHLEFMREVMDNPNPFNVSELLGLVTNTGLFCAPVAGAVLEYNESINNAREFKRQSFPKEEKTKVAHVTGSFYREKGCANRYANGVGISSREWAEIVQDDELYDVITWGNDNPELGEIVMPVVDKIIFPEYTDYKLGIPLIKDIYDLYLEKDYDAVNVATPDIFGLMHAFAAWSLGRNLYFSHQTEIVDYAFKYTGSKDLANQLKRGISWIYNHSHGVLAMSEASKDKLVSYGVKPEKIRIAPRGIHVEEYASAAGGWELNGRHNNLLFMGRLVEDKNPLKILEAFKRMNDPNATLTYVGDGELRGQLERQAAGYNVYFTGEIYGPDKVAQMARSGVLVVYNPDETLCRVAIESQAAGMAVIVPDKGGAPENMIEGKTGFVARSDDLDDLVAKMKQLVGNRDLCSRMGHEAFQYAQTRSVERAFNDMRDLFV